MGSSTTVGGSTGGSVESAAGASAGITAWGASVSLAVADEMGVTASLHAERVSISIIHKKIRNFFIILLTPLFSRNRERSERPASRLKLRVLNREAGTR